MLHFKGPSLFRGRVVCSILSGKDISITEIREQEEAPGLREYEMSFLRLVDKLTNGTMIKIDSTGTKITLKPGVISGIGYNGIYEHDCSNTGRSIGYFIEGILPLCLFSKEQVRIAFLGVTSDDRDICIETLQYVTTKILENFGVELVPTFKLARRGTALKGGGKVEFVCSPVKKLHPVQILDPGYIKRVRGIAYSARVSPQFSNRMVNSCRGVLNNFIPDVYINTDHVKDRTIGPGFGIMLYAESTTGCVYGTKRIATAASTDLSNLHPGPLLDPEAIGANAAKQLCEQIVRGSCIDSSHQALTLLLMVLTPEDVSKVRMSYPSKFTMEYLRLIQRVFGVKAKLVLESTSVLDGSNHMKCSKEEYCSVVCSIRGIGFNNISRRVT